MREGAAPSEARGGALYAATIFVGAFLLFQVQPIIGKFVLPWFGGSAGVWAAALLFFQLFLLLGYAYAHAVSTWLGLRGQAITHLAALALAVAVLPIIPSDGLKPDTTDNPVLNIILLLSLTVGGPYLLLAANGPLLQGWFARQYPGRSPYRLYALSNIASLLALLSYPLSFERLIGLQTQAWLWSGTYLLFTVLCAVIAAGWLRAASRQAANPESTPAVAAIEVTERPEARGRPWQVVLWLLFPAVASGLLLATTNRLTQEIAPVPLLWVLPLSLYLLSFILTFDSDRWYHRLVYVPIVLLFLAGAAYTILRPGELTLMQQAALLLGALYFTAMLCHGELVALRPGVRHLTTFYLAVSAGGALGGAVVAMGAPAFLDGYWEFHIFLVVAAVAVAVAMALQVVQTADNRYRFAALLATGLTFGVAVALGTQINNRVNFERSGKFLVSRNFYSAIQVQDVWTNDENLHQMQMVHGQTLHGIQFQKPERRAWHTSYFGEDSGLGVAMEYHPGRAAGRPLRVGVIGLGTGSVASYARRGDVLRYYEIDPQVDRIAHEHFSYLDDARARGAAVDVLLGDARIVLERERDRGDLQRFDIVVVDAFNSDAIPVHLLTREAVELYRAHLVPDGLIVVNTSNRFLDLTPVMRALAEENRLDIRVFTSHDDTERALNRSEFVVLTGNRGFLEDPAVTREADPIIEGKPPVLWTDDYSALLPLLRF